MVLHRVKDKADWVGVGKKNRFQRLAVRSGGLVTPGNIFSVIGLALVLFGLYSLLAGNNLLAFWLIVSGRLCDLLDGWLADITGTKSRLGESVDVIIDKFVTVMMFIAMISLGLLPWWLVVLLVLPQLLIIVVGYHKRQQRIRLQPSLYGKVSMGLLWLSLLSVVAIKLISIQGVQLLLVMSYSFAIASAVFAVVAVSMYWRIK